MELMKRLAFLLMLLVLLSCRQQVPETDYRSGTQGLAINFLPGSPPAKVYSGSPLGLALELRNSGAYDIDGEARIFLTGYDPEAISFHNLYDRHVQMDVPPILGKSPYMPDGGYEILDIPDSGARVPQGDSYTPTLMATSCYRYKTLATPTVCIVSDPAAILRDRVCEPKTVTLTSQGAPVAVTKVEEEVMQQSINFIITIRNMGDGRVIDKDQLDKCPFDLKHTDVNIVDVEVELTGAGTPECNPSDMRVRLVDGTGVFFCRFPVALKTSYTTPLVIRLDYGYSSSVTRSVEIVNPPGTRP